MALRYEARNITQLRIGYCECSALRSDANQLPYQVVMQPFKIRAVAVIFCQSVIVKQITVSLTVIDR
jgi:hypothetical protein